jgi:asparagine synthase (glutamine-hydrolysing)
MVVHGPVAMGTRRLSILDVAGSNQPLVNEAGTLWLVGNGEIFNYVELREMLLARGHRFATQGDLETLLHLFEEYGPDFVHHVNGQFSVALFDARTNELHLFRDHFGITPLFYVRTPRALVFGSEVKAILCHPAVSRAVDLAGLDQIVCFPGLVSPRTMFTGIRALPPGHRLYARDGMISEHEYWDLDYPSEDIRQQTPQECAPQFLRLFDRAVELRMRSERDVGVYLSGGLDSSFVAASMRMNRPAGKIRAFSIVFPESRAIDEARYQRLMARHLELEHIEVEFRDCDIARHLQQMIWHAECPVKETYNTCAMALAGAARDNGVPVVLGGEGADELLAGYPGYRFDSLALQTGKPEALDPAEAAARRVLWGSESVRYERKYHPFGQWRRQLFSAQVLDAFAKIDALSCPPVNTERLNGRHPIHQRSYLDCKMRLTDHLLGDHGDRMAMSQSVEARFPFLDPQLVDFVRGLSPDLKVKGLEEKILLRHAAATRVPAQILRREKFGFRSPGSPCLFGTARSLIEEVLHPDRVRRQGYLNVDTVEELKRRQATAGQFNPHAEDDLLLIALTFGMFVEQFSMPALCA